MNDIPLYGVNLGGWLLLEKWMTPSLFAGTDAVDEYTFMQTPSAYEKITKHRDTFITEGDFKWLHHNGITAIRIPFGYWVFESQGPYLEVARYLDWAVEMAAKYELEVILDLHGLQGSQNGNDHSGKVGHSDWLKDATLRRQSLDTLERIAKRYKEYSHIWGIQVINEPSVRLFHFALRRFYKDAYARLIPIMRPGTRFIYSDGFTPRLLNGALRAVDGFPVVMDVHIYHMSTARAKKKNVDWFMKLTAGRTKLIAKLQAKQPIIIGEWSGVISHEVARNFTPESINPIFTSYVALQKQVFEHTAGWFYWNYKTEERGQWNYRSQVEDGLITVSHH